MSAIQNINLRKFTLQALREAGGKLVVVRPSDCEAFTVENRGAGYARPILVSHRYGIAGAANTSREVQQIIQSKFR